MMNTLLSALDDIRITASDLGNNSTDLNTLLDLESCFYETVKATTANRAGLTFGCSLAENGKSISNEADFFLGQESNFNELVRTRVQRTLKAIRPCLELLFSQLMGIGDLERTANFCSRYAQFMPDSKVLHEAAKACGKLQPPRRSSVAAPRETIPLFDIQPVPFLFSLPQSVVWDQENRHYLISHAKSIAIFSEDWLPLGTLCDHPAISGEFRNFFMLDMGDRYVMSGFAKNIAAVDKKTGRLLQNKELDCYVSYAKKLPSGDILATTYQDKAKLYERKLVIIDKELNISDKLDIPLKYGEKFSSLMISQDAINIIPYADRPLLRLISETSGNAPIELCRTLTQSFPIIYTQKFNGNILFSSYNSIGCFGPNLTQLFIKPMPECTQYDFAMTDRDGQEEIYIVGHNTTLFRMQPVGFVPAAS